MANTTDIRIPDIGDAENVEIIEVLVAVGDTVELEQSLLTLESDKASMEVPATEAGTIVSLTVSVGDTANSGDVIGTLDAASGGSGEPSGSDAGNGADDAAARRAAGDASPTPASGKGQQATTGVDPAHGDTTGARSTTAHAAGVAATSGAADGAASAGSGNAGGGTIDVTVPDIGDAGDVEVIEVLVAVGDTVTVEQSLITLESDKASMEVPSPAAGTVERVDITVGDSVTEGSALLVLRADGAGAGDGDDDAASSGAAGAPGSGGSRDGGTGGGTEAGSGEGSTSSSAQADPRASAAGAAPEPRERPTSPTAHISDEKMRLAHASPGVRRYAREHGADLSQIKGNGPKGRILKEDVVAFIKQAMEGIGSSYGGGGASGQQAFAGGGMGIPPVPEVDFSKFGETERVELSRINKLSAKNLHRAWLNVPMVTHHDEVDVTEMEAFRKELKASAKEGDPKVTGLAFHMKALAATLRAFPRLNASLAADGESLIMKKYCHIGIAVDTPNGLVVPVFRDVDRKSINELADEMSDMSSRARAKKLKPDEMQGASMTISSLGGIGGTAFTPIVNAPEVAILGITRARMQPVWNGKEFIPRLMCPLDLSYDHRVVDGAEAARFMAHYVQAAGDIRRLLL